MPIGTPVTLAMSNHEGYSDESYTRTTEELNRAVYDGPDHTLSAKDQMTLYRTYPKRNGASRGSAKCAVKFVKDTEVPNADGSGSIVLPDIWEISASIPVGTSEAEIDEMRIRLATALLSTSLADLFKKLHIQ